jgi:cell division protein FtsW
VLSKAFPDSKLFSRVQTWESELRISARISLMKMTTKLRKQNRYIASGKIYGLGPGKVSKEFLPQSSSDFIYAIIVSMDL